MKINRDKQNTIECSGTVINIVKHASLGARNEYSVIIRNCVGDHRAFKNCVHACAYMEKSYDFVNIQTCQI